MHSHGSKPRGSRGPEGRRELYRSGPRTLAHPWVPLQVSFCRQTPHPQPGGQRLPAVADRAPRQTFVLSSPGFGGQGTDGCGSCLGPLGSCRCVLWCQSGGGGAPLGRQEDTATQRCSWTLISERACNVHLYTAGPGPIPASQQAGRFPRSGPTLSAGREFRAQ